MQVSKFYQWNHNKIKAVTVGVCLFKAIPTDYDFLTILIAIYIKCIRNNVNFHHFQRINESA